MCCNGVIFADVKLQPADDAARLRALGIPVSSDPARTREKARGVSPHSPARAMRFSQPCAALEGCECKIYRERPKYCREFDCLLLKKVKTGQLQTPVALQIIRTTSDRAETVRELLRELGDNEETLPLATRFKRTSRRLEKVGLDSQAGEIYAQLTLAFHDLNLMLQKEFYR
jgi:Fe-S-cluster containining protein